MIPKRSPKLASLVAVGALSFAAFAQWAHGGPPAKAPASASATASAAPASSVDPAKLEQAKKHMEAGAALYDDPSGHKCEEAYVEFSKAYELSGSLRALKNRAVCALELEKDGEALADFKAVLAGIGDKLDASERERIQTDVKTLESATAWITVTTDKPNVRITDTRTPPRGFPVTNKYNATITGIKLGVHPGEHTFTATAEDGKELVWKVSLTNGSSQEHAFNFTSTAPPIVTADGAKPDDLTAKPIGSDTAPTATATSTGPGGEAKRPTPTSVYVAAGVTGAALIGTGVMMGLAAAAKGDFDASNGKLPMADLQGKRDNVVTMNLVSDVLLGVTAAGAAATIILYVIRPSVKAEESSKASVIVTPAFTPKSGGAVVTGRF